MINFLLLCGVAFSCQLYQLDSKKSIQVGFVECLQGYTGLPFVGIYKKDIFQTSKDAFSFVRAKATHKSPLDYDLILKGYTRFIKKFAVQRLHINKKLFNNIICHSKIALGCAAAVYFYSSDLKHSFAYGSSSLLFAVNAFTRGRLEEEDYFSFIKAGLKHL